MGEDEVHVIVDAGNDATVTLAARERADGRDGADRAQRSTMHVGEFQ